MVSFADEAFITVCSGNGGNGCISFRREKFIPLGGPAGGDGGRGGDVIFRVKNNMRTLSKLRYKHIFKARNGQDGMGRQCYGKNGEDIIIFIPPGTRIFDAVTGEFLKEFTTQSEGDSYVCLTGGNGGWGNMHFKTSTNQAPRYAHEGKKGITRDLRLELSIMADVGLVGLPNAGKSSLLNAITNARPKVAPYPFTTKIPGLGAMHITDETDIIIADIPGIISGAANGKGLGLQFLKHISRTKCLVYIIDCADDNYLKAFDTLREELRQFDKSLLDKPFLLLCNKIDIDNAHDNAKSLINMLKLTYPDIVAIPISAMCNIGLKSFRQALMQLVSNQERLTAKPTSNISSFMQERSLDESVQTQYPGQEL